MATTLTTDSIEQFQQWLTARGRLENTAKARGADLRVFFGMVGSHTTDEFEELAQDFLNEVRKEKAPRTIERYIGTLRNFGRWAGIPDALSDYLGPKPAKPQPHPLKEGGEGVDTMLNLCRSDTHRNLIALTGMVGLRVGEAVTVTHDDIDIVERTIKVRGKGDRERVVPVSDRAMRVLAFTLAHRTAEPRLVPLHERSARKAITRLGERAGLARRASSHDMRATFATEAYAATKDLRAVQELLGHADSRTTQVYTGVSMDAMRRAANAVADPDEEVA